ncbi:MAG: 3-deoxy-manno-octulosonate cytidylyltransferase [Clostridiales bacterium]|nr:3-deoxy-manno-octulosonate cytidylyltransferase [Clostridiales bacterium]
MKITGIIPARYQSSRFPGKPLALICQKPMLWWVYHQAFQVRGFDEVLVATDSPLIIEECRKWDIPAKLTRDTHPTGTDRLGEIAAASDSDFFVNIQGDEPLIEPSVIQSIIDYRMAHPEVEIINTMTPLGPKEDVRATSLVKAVAAANGDLLYLSRSPIPGSKNGDVLYSPQYSGEGSPEETGKTGISYMRHLGLYGLSRDALLFYARTPRGILERTEDIEMLRFLENGYRIKILKVYSKSVGVDLPEDIGRAEAAIRERDAAAAAEAEQREGME